MGGAHNKPKHGECTVHSGKQLFKECTTCPEHIYVCKQCMISTHKGHNCVKITKRKERRGQIDTDIGNGNTNAKVTDDNSTSAEAPEDNVADSPGAFPNKVSVSGSGIQNGTLGNFRGDIVVETRGAGEGKFSISVNGPKGGFHVETYREHEFDRTISCRYYPTTTGNYVINIKWAGVHVPGSPFSIQVLNSQEELEKL